MARAHILVVDDESVIRTFVVAVLREEGYELYTAGDGEAALAAIRTVRPDLVLLDIAMPVLSGDGVLQQLKADGSTVPVVVMTAGPVRREWLASGARAILAKPFGIAELVDAVGIVLARSNGA